MFEHIQRLSECFIELCREGNFNYFHWQETFTVLSVESERISASTEETVYIGTLADIEERIACMEQELVSWRKQKAEARAEFYLLTYYTTPQLLLISHELGKLLQQRQQQKVFDDSILMLLQAVNSQVSAEDIAVVLSEVIAGRRASRSQTQKLEKPVTSYNTWDVGTMPNKGEPDRPTIRSSKSMFTIANQA